MLPLQTVRASKNSKDLPRLEDGNTHRLVENGGRWLGGLGNQKLREPLSDGNAVKKIKSTQQGIYTRQETYDCANWCIKKDDHWCKKEKSMVYPDSCSSNHRLLQKASCPWPYLTCSD